VAVDWDTAIEPAHAGESDTSLYVTETLGELVSELECEELMTPAKREMDAEGRVAAPATRVARRVTAEEVTTIYSYSFTSAESYRGVFGGGAPVPPLEVKKWHQYLM